jgi:hypothetical protein
MAALPVWEETDAGVSSAVQERVWSLRKLAGWDLEDADEITQETCAAALDFLQEAARRGARMEDPRFVAPGVTGVIGLHWQSPAGRLLLEISGLNPSRIYRQWVPTQGRRASGCVDREEALRLVTSLYD